MIDRLVDLLLTPGSEDVPDDIHDESAVADGQVLALDAIKRDRGGPRARQGHHSHLDLGVYPSKMGSIKP